MAELPKTVDVYLADLPQVQRALQSASDTVEMMAAANTRLERRVRVCLALTAVEFVAFTGLLFYVVTH